MSAEGCGWPKAGVDVRTVEGAGVGGAVWSQGAYAEARVCKD